MLTGTRLDAVTNALFLFHAPHLLFGNRGRTLQGKLQEQGAPSEQLSLFDGHRLVVRSRLGRYSIYMRGFPVILATRSLPSLPLITKL